jgi:hypothetical protein
MYHKFNLFLVSFLLCYTQTALTEETSYYSTLFDGNGFISVGDKNIVIPKKLPYYKNTEEKIYLTISNDKPANEKNIHVEFGLKEGCFGQNVCDFATYAVEVISPQLLSNLMLSFEVSAIKVVLQGNIEGYYFPSKCYAYCNEAKLFWFNRGRIYMIGTKFGADNTDAIKQLKDSANSFIEEEYDNGEVN